MMVLKSAQFIHMLHCLILAIKQTSSLSEFRANAACAKLYQHQASVANILTLTQKVRAHVGHVIDAGLVKKRTEEKHIIS